MVSKFISGGMTGNGCPGHSCRSAKKGGRLLIILLVSLFYIFYFLYFLYLLSSIIFSFAVIFMILVIIQFFHRYHFIIPT